MTTVRHQWDVAILGGGPAGLNAAITAADYGAEVGLVDQFPAPGGQYFMQTRNVASTSRRMKEGRTLIDRARAAGVTILTEHEVFGLGPDKLMARHGRNAVTVSWKALVLATGAHDRVFPFPGWTLPGVMTPGAAQRLIKTQGMLPGRHIVLAGSGPFLYAVAETILAAGGNLKGLHEVRRPGIALMAHLVRYPERWHELVGLLVPLIKARVRPRFGSIVVEAEGDDRVEAVRIAPLDKQGLPRLEQATRIEPVDTLLVGYGFRPLVETACVLGCELDYDDDLGGWHVVVRPESGATSVPGVFAAGEITGVRGSLPARLAGRRAGAGAARHAGFDADSIDRSVRGDRDGFGRAYAFGEKLQRLHPVPANIDRLIADDVIVCRCEDVTVGELRRAIEAGAPTASGAKMWTRACMGRCQGRMCAAGVARIAARSSGIGLDDIGENRARIPIRPVPLDIAFGAFADESDQ